jgi:hypothetical protein
MSNANTPASPVKPEIIQGNNQVHLGLTKREHFAGLALQGLCANSERTVDTESDLVRDAISIADELLKQLEADK